MRCRQIFFRLSSVSARRHTRTATRQHPNGASLPGTRTRPPRHLADLDPAARRAAAAELGGEPFRGDQLARREVPGGPGRVSNVVFMGMGEPLANYPQVITALRRLTDPVPDGLGISQRSVTVSTVGLVPAIRRLTAERLGVTVAVSLHAPDDGLRDELVPVNKRWKVAEVLGAAWEYAAATRRRVSVEYAMIKDVNDQP